MSENKALYCIVDASEAELGVVTDIKLYTSSDPWTLAVTIGCVPLTVFDGTECVGCLAYQNGVLLFHSLASALNVIRTASVGGANLDAYHVVLLSELRGFHRLNNSFGEVSPDGK